MGRCLRLSWEYASSVRWIWLPCFGTAVGALSVPSTTGGGQGPHEPSYDDRERLLSISISLQDGEAAFFAR
jgi:hypothetical protein